MMDRWVRFVIFGLLIGSAAGVALRAHRDGWAVVILLVGSLIVLVDGDERRKK